MMFAKNNGTGMVDRFACHCSGLPSLVIDWMPAGCVTLLVMGDLHGLQNTRQEISSTARTTL